MYYDTKDKYLLKAKRMSAEKSLSFHIRDLLMKSYNGKISQFYLGDFSMLELYYLKTKDCI